MSRRKFFCIAFACSFMMGTNFLYAQNLAKEISDKALEFESAGESIGYLNKMIGQIKSPAEKRALLAFLASLQEQISAYKDASDSYAQAAGIAAGDAQGMPKKTSPQLVLDAVRCALCSGDSATAEKYLNSAVRNSQDEKIQATIKLYEVWSALCKLESTAQLEESVTILKTYAALPSMKIVKPQILLTLWYITGEASYGDSLKKEFPKSPEVEVVNGKIQMMPAPFWYFMPKKGEALALSAESAAESQKISVEKSNDENKGGEKAAKQQLGLFRNKDNAQALCDTLKSKGFSPYITEETRASGTKYYIVVVDENAAGNIGQQLRSAGFECYTVF